MKHLGGGSLLLEDAEATERSIKTARLDRYGILHLAAHGLVDDERPERSGVLLAPSDGDDGLLQIREVVDLDLGGRVVVLSACRSASGAILQGEGVIGLARAFFVAGAHTVVASLWPLKDDEAARFFEGFYRHIAEGRSVGSAMSAARAEVARSGGPAAAWGRPDGDGRRRRRPAAGRPSRIHRGLGRAALRAGDPHRRRTLHPVSPDPRHACLTPLVLR